MGDTLRALTGFAFSSELLGALRLSLLAQVFALVTVHLTAVDTVPDLVELAKSARRQADLPAVRLPRGDPDVDVQMRCVAMHESRRLRSWERFFQPGGEHLPDLGGADSALEAEDRRIVCAYVSSCSVGADVFVLQPLRVLTQTLHEERVASRRFGDSGRQRLKPDAFRSLAYSLRVCDVANMARRGAPLACADAKLTEGSTALIPALTSWLSGHEICLSNS